MTTTPGPWTPFYNDTEGIHLLNNDDVIVCKWVHTEDDALVIAAAPEMRDAARRLRMEAMHYLTSGRGAQYLRDAMATVDALLARIEGAE